jgi:hypothetical protein
MKKLILSLSTAPLLVLCPGPAGAQTSTFYDSNGLDYSMNAVFPNNPPLVSSVTGLPTPSLLDLEPMLQGFITTDGSGKINGVQYARVYFGGLGDHTNNYATFVINVTGSIRTSGTVPAVKLKLQGGGYDMDAQSDHPDASLALTFTSAKAPVTVAPNRAVTILRTNYTVTYLNGSPVLLTTNQPTPYSDYYINPANYGVTFLFTNGPATYANTESYWMIGGTLTGTIKPGKKSNVNGGKPAKINEPAALFSQSVMWAVVDDTNFVQQSVGGSLAVNVLSKMTVQVVQPVPGKNLYLAGGVGSAQVQHEGTGTVDYSKGTFKAKVIGVEYPRGVSLSLSGTLGPVIIGYQPTTNPSFPTGYVTNRLLNALQKITFSGKALGQKIPATSGVNPDATFP